MVTAKVDVGLTGAAHWYFLLFGVYAGVIVTNYNDVLVIFTMFNKTKLTASFDPLRPIIIVGSAAQRPFSVLGRKTASHRLGLYTSRFLEACSHLHSSQPL